MADTKITTLFLDIGGVLVRPEQVAYLEDRPLLVEMANRLSINGVRPIDAATTRQGLQRFGLEL